MRKKNRSARFFLTKILKAFQRIGLSKITDNREKEIGAKPPKIRKIFQRILQLSFRKQINFYTIKVRTSVDEERKRFNDIGKIKILVVSAKPGVGEEIVFYRSFQRRKGAEDKVIKLVEALDIELSNRPSDSKGRFMNLVQISPRVSVWRSPQYKRNKEEKKMFLNLPVKLSAFIEKEQYKWNYYQEVLRKRLGIKRYESEIIKKWDIKNPENAVPVN
ncbi:MAG: hypothetical protein KBC11_00135 [Candidatus Pacebacteria bacterium]|nr:hypothetical protein [Candidatus Paceibacterota bacterium]